VQNIKITNLNSGYGAIGYDYLNDGFVLKAHW